MMDGETGTGTGYDDLYHDAMVLFSPRTRTRKRPFLDVTLAGARECVLLLLLTGIVIRDVELHGTRYGLTNLKPGRQQDSHIFEHWYGVWNGAVTIRYDTTKKGRTVFREAI